ncbi:hypothetical protein L2X99_08095 [Microbacterium sp. KUDC0406]|uniref:GerMN domain-containing protein n=1 Tax=Microbacterium sp. KUDC0406 TaxID=2909588 RepID=UPI001F372B74|nr:hypothetical protein [Microbacterium sp. KUDC0406]UJP11452.1 hypothetical protein L2X99_08095 [Microbacterium sp. KUDC0406]
MRGIRALAAGAVTAAMLLLASCTGLPTTGPVSVGLAVGEKGDGPSFTEYAATPREGADPQEIVEGFLDAGITPIDNWSIAREFLTPEMSDSWAPTSGVTVDTSSASRSITAVGDIDDEDTTSADVTVQLAQVASVDGAGAYSAGIGDTAPLKFHLERKKGGEWRISEAPNGIVLDAVNFPLVYRSYSLQYFDPSWAHLVPDVRWYPRRPSTATTLTQQLVSGEPTPWLAPGVRSAFTDEVGLARGAVVIDQSQVAEVDLTRSALNLDATTLARMRTQLEATLAPSASSRCASPWISSRWTSARCRWISPARTPARWCSPRTASVRRWATRSRRSATCRRRWTRTPHACARSTSPRTTRRRRCCSTTGMCTWPRRATSWISTAGPG